jgi:hypothetical protein
MNYQKKFIKYNNKNKLFGGNLEKYTVYETENYRVCVINAVDLTEELKLDIIEKLKLCFPFDDFQTFKNLYEPSYIWFLLIAKRDICVENGKIASLLCFSSPSKSRPRSEIEKVCTFFDCRGKIGPANEKYISILLNIFGTWIRTNKPKKIKEEEDDPEEYEDTVYLYINKEKNDETTQQKLVKLYSEHGFNLNNELRNLIIMKMEI